MTIDLLAHRLSTSAGLSGGFLLVAAFACWVTGGVADVAQAVHHVAAFVMAAFGVVFIGVGLTLSATVPDIDQM
ncbi:hypothetical protein [Nocardioides ungokensis]|uniref:hypothetical protein n=1 Tax=Nocardioides ungokensis TaxID=1643322 RepID=UPI0015DEA4BA|nr:hypothetical protein [Nocardioides ungokensis]